jgi:hypothetical protein
MLFKNEEFVAPYVILDVWVAYTKLVGIFVIVRVVVTVATL